MKSKVKCVNNYSKFKQNYCLYFTGVVLAHLVLKAITLLHNIGISIDGIVCDGATTDRKIVSLLGIVGTQSETKHYFEHQMIPNE